MRKPQADRPYSSPDGIVRSRAVETKLNLMAAAVLGTPAGQELMTYLKSITINNVNGPGFDVNQLIHMEGQRYIVSVLAQRIEQGHKEKAV